MKTTSALHEDSAARLRRVHLEQRCQLWQIRWLCLALLGFIGLWITHK